MDAGAIGRLLHHASAIIEAEVPRSWAVEVVGKDVVVRFGRVGRGGQVQRKSFPSVSAASLERDVEVGGAT